MSRTDDSRTLPRSVRHKQILEFAETNPDASVAEIAAEIPSATEDLVENILEEYGDPAEDTASSGDEATTEADANNRHSGMVTIDTPKTEADDQSGQTATDTTTTAPEPTRPDGSNRPEKEEDDSGEGGCGDTQDGESEDNHHEPTTAETATDRSAESSVAEATETDETAVALADLSEKQRETLRAVAEQPQATQQEIAAQLGVSAPTVSNRANSIPGFDWQERQAFVEAVFDEQQLTNGAESTATQEPTDSTIAATEPMQQASSQSDESTDKTDLDALNERISELETQVESLRTAGPERTDDLDAEVLHKVLAVCIESDRISDAEERRLLEALR